MASGSGSGGAEAALALTADAGLPNRKTCNDRAIKYANTILGGSNDAF